MEHKSRKKYLLFAVLILVLVGSIFTYLFIKFLKSRSETQQEIESETEDTKKAGYTFEQDWWLKPQTYSYIGELEYFKTQNYTTVWWGQGLTSPEKILTQIKDEIELYHAQGIKYIVPISLIDIEDQSNTSVIQQINSEMMEAVVLKLNGDPQILITGFAGDPDLVQYAYDINHTKWQEYILEQAKAAVDAGADGINLDDISGNRQWVEMGLGSFNSASKTKFRNYLKGKYSSSELSTIGISDIDNFDYSDFLIQRGWTVDTLGSSEYPYHGDFPLYEDFLDFQSKVTAEFASLIITTTKQYAQEKYSRTIMFTECCEYRDDAAKYMDQYFDLLTAGVMYGKGRTYQHIVAYKLGVAASGGSPMVAWLGDTEVHFAQQEIRDLNNIYLAESYANKAQLVGSAGTGEAKKYNEFIMDQPDIFDFSKLESKARVGLLYSLTTLGSEEFYGLSHSLFFNLGQLLTDCHYQFDVVYSHGDDLEADDLSQYEVLVLPQTNLLTNEEKEALISYVTSGGKILYIGYHLPFNAQELDYGIIHYRPEWSETSDLYGQHIQYNATSNLNKAFPEFFQLPPEQPTSMDLSQTRNDFQSLVNDYLNERMIDEVDKDKLSVVSWQNQDKLILHLINYDFDYSAKQINEKSDIQIMIDADIISNPSKVIVYSPDFSKEEISFSVEEGYLTFIIPSLWVWDVVVVE
jgi:hypothetical protein